MPRPELMQPPTAPTRRSRIAEGYEMLWTAIHNIFAPSGMTHDGTVPDSSSLILPEPHELVFVPDDGDGNAIIHRNMNGTLIPLAAAKTNTIELNEFNGAYKNTNLAGPKWIQCYTFFNRPRRASMLGVDDPGANWTDEKIAAVLAAHEDAANPTKVKLRSTSAAGVATGVSDSGVKRITWNGHSGFGLARWMGANGWSGKDAVATYARLGITMGKSAIVGGVYAGKAGLRGTPAPVTAAQAAVLEAARLACGGETKPMTATLLASTTNGTVRAESPAPSPAMSNRQAKKLAKDAKLDAAIKARKAAGKR